MLAYDQNKVLSYYKALTSVSLHWVVSRPSALAAKQVVHLIELAGCPTVFLSTPCML
jgi:hypothetical protein